MSYVEKNVVETKFIDFIPFLYFSLFPTVNFSCSRPQDVLR